MIVGLSGKIGSGKSAASEYIVSNYGFRCLSTSSILRSVLESKNLATSRENLQIIGSSLVKTIGGGGFMAVMFEYLPKGDYAVDSIRHKEAVQYLRRRFVDDFSNIYIDSDFDTRFLRTKGQYESISRFKEIDNADSELEIEALKAMSDVVLSNNKGLKDLLNQVRNFLSAIGINGLVVNSHLERI